MKVIEATSASFHRKNDGEISSKIHSLIKGGKVEVVLALLGRPYLISGKVIHGQALGRTLGFPTMQTLEDLVKEMKHSGPVFRQKVYTVMRSSYSSHYRKMVPAILEAIDFRSNNDLHQPVIEAL